MHLELLQYLQSMSIVTVILMSFLLRQVMTRSIGMKTMDLKVLRSHDRPAQIATSVLPSILIRMEYRCFSASYYDDKIAWYENNGSESFPSHDTTSADKLILSLQSMLIMTEISMFYPLL